MAGREGSWVRYAGLRVYSPVLETESGGSGGREEMLTEKQLLATLCCCCLCDDCCGPTAVAGPAVIPVGAVGPGFGAPVGGGCCDPGCCFIC